MSQTSGSINYRLNQAALLWSFPFTDGQVDTVEKLNNKMGGYVESIIGAGMAAINLSASVGGNEWKGNLADHGIEAHRGYWLKPTGSSDTWGPNEYVNTTISGTIKNSTDKYDFHFGNNLISYPFDENKAWDDAVDGEDLYYNQGVTDIIGAEASSGAQSAKTWNTSLNRWVGGINNFMSGSGYWMRTTSGGLKTIWKAPTGSNAINFEFRDCTDGWNHERYGKICHTVRDKVTGWHHTSEHPFSQSAHTFGWKTSQQQTFHYFSSSIGGGTGSLLDSASNTVGSWDEARNGNYSNFIVGFFPQSSSAAPYPACCAADYWFSHEEFQNVHPSTWAGGESKALDWPVQWQTSYTPELSESYGYANSNTGLDVKVYDPRRNLVVPAALFHVDYTDGNPNLPVISNNSVVVSGSSLTHQFHMSASRSTSNQIYVEPMVIKMLE